MLPHDCGSMKLTTTFQLACAECKGKPINPSIGALQDSSIVPFLYSATKCHPLPCSPALMQKGGILAQVSRRGHRSGEVDSSFGGVIRRILIVRVRSYLVQSFLHQAMRVVDWFVVERHFWKVCVK
jgi:hypothetical protein